MACSYDVLCKTTALIILRIQPRGGFPMQDCIFCKIARHEIQALVICEDDFTIAFMDIARDVDGHILVIPKPHCESILDCDPEPLAHVMRTVKTVSNHLVDHCGYEGVNLLNASGTAAGQSLPHFHIHIIPRRHDDGLGSTGAWPSFPGATQELTAMHAKLTVLK